MLYTNGIIVVHKTNNLEELKEMIAKVASYLLEQKGEQHVFEFTEEYEFPAYKLPNGVEFQDLDDVLRPYVAFRAINEDEVFLTKTTTIDKRYDFSQDELQDIANDITSHFKKKKGIEAEKKIAVKNFDSDISDQDKKLNEKIDLHRNGYEQRDFKAKVKYNFKEGKKYYIDVNDETNILKEEKLNSEEKKMRIDHKYEKPAQQTLFEEAKPDTIVAEKKEGAQEPGTFADQLLGESVTKETDDLVI